MNLKPIILSISILLFSSSCISGIDYYYKYEPIYISTEVLKRKIKDKIKITEPKKIINVGKIYTYNNYLFISENNMGVHIIDNTDPKKPVNKAFLGIPLNEDISIKGDVLYADSYDELVAVDISNIEKINVTKRIKLASFFTNPKFHFEKSSGFMIGEKKTPVYEARVFSMIMARSSTSSNSYSSSSSMSYSTGKGGSLSRFSIVGDYLYTVTNTDLNLFSLADNKNPQELGKVKIENVTRAETIYSYKDKLFIGTATGAYTYDNKDPQKPVFISKIEHVRSCDPVVVENDTAYITLRDGSTCRGGVNELDAVDLADIKNQKILKTYPLENPWGLAIKDNILFVCDYNNGIKIFNAQDPKNLIEITTIPIKKAKDIIINENNLGIVVTDDGIHEYDFSGLLQKTNFQELSYIKAEQIPEEIKEIKDGKIEVYYRWYKEYLEK